MILLLENSLGKKIPNSVYPNLVTVINIFFGFYSVINAFKGDYLLAFWCIIAGAIADALDGKVARYVNGASEFGIQYDSLADMVTFGFAPSALVYNVLGQSDNAFILAISFFPLLFGGIRLARFNANLVGFDKDSFIGLPIPSAAISIASLIPLSDYMLKKEWIDSPLWNSQFEVFVISVVLCSVLMVTRIPYHTLPNFTFKQGKENLIKLIIFAVFFPLTLINTHLMLSVSMLIFVTSGIIQWILSSIRKK